MLMFWWNRILEFLLVIFGAALSDTANQLLINGIALIFVFGIVIQGVVDIVIRRCSLRDEELQYLDNLRDNYAHQWS